MDADVLPVNAQPTHWKPLTRAIESAVVMPVSLNEPVGFIPWCLARSASTPADFAQRASG